jgi:hypothetical protein
MTTTRTAQSPYLSREDAEVSVFTDGEVAIFGIRSAGLTADLHVSREGLAAIQTAVNAALVQMDSK